NKRPQRKPGPSTVPILNRDRSTHTHTRHAVLPRRRRPVRPKKHKLWPVALKRHFCDYVAWQTTLCAFTDSKFSDRAAIAPRKFDFVRGGDFRPHPVTSNVGPAARCGRAR